MAGPGTQFTGPIQSGPIWNQGDLRGPVNTGLVELSQRVTLTANGTNTVTGIIYLPPNSWIKAFALDTIVAWNSGGTDPLTVGATAGGTDYVSSTSVQTAGRPTITYTAAQLTNMQNIGTNTAVYFTVTPTGAAATAGTTIAAITYVQVVENLDYA